MIIVGLTGGIASGKSFVVSYLKKIRIPTHESDLVVKNLYNKPTNSFINFLKKEGFEKAFLKKKINKNIIREEVFNKTEKRKKLEKYLHNEVRKNRKEFIKKNKKKKIIFLDIPLLFENKLERLCDYICSTIAPLKTRKARALQRPGMKKKVFDQIVKTQEIDKNRKKKSHYLINTSKTKIKTCLQVDCVIYDIFKNIKNQ